MERFCFEVPGPARKADAIDFIREFYAYNSEIHGTGGLDRYLDDYEGWLGKLETDYAREPSEEKVPARTYFLVRESDRRIVGMSNIRLALNERLRQYGGHIGYSIRPAERGKGYNKINLYLGLKVCGRYGIDTVLLDADLDNPASWKTMEALGGVRVREYFEDQYDHCTVVDYTIDVKKALADHADYERFLVRRDLPEACAMKRVLVIGCPGSGKSTFSRALRDAAGLPLYHLDMMYWNPDRTIVDKSVFLSRLDEALQKEDWIIDGNYQSTMEQRMKACDTVIFLDYPRELCLRSIRERRGKDRPDMPWREGSDEEDPEFIATIENFETQNRPKILELLEKYASKNVCVFRSREEADAFLAALRRESGDPSRSGKAERV